MRQQPVYLIVRRTGQFDPDGVELVIVYDVKLTRGTAEAVVALNPGTEIIKKIADKEVP
jgi:hypothetical protein